MTTFVRPGLVVSVIALALTGGCAARGPTARVTPGPSAAVLDASPSLVQTVIDRAFALVGSPYRLGGADPSGFDCSGFVAYVFAQAGIGLPRTVASLATRGASVPTGYPAPGDLLFFATSSGRASHVAIALGNDRFVHAPSSRGVVRVERLDADYWARRYLGARRVIPPALPGEVSAAAPRE